MQKNIAGIITPTYFFSLEIFDTKSDIDYTANKTVVKTPLGDAPVIEATGQYAFDCKNRMAHL